MEMAEIIKGELKKRGLRPLKAAAQTLGVSTELLRRIVNGIHVPKDRTLIKIARSLELDPAVLILAAHRQKLPRELSSFTLSPVAAETVAWERKRTWPLSQEQCEYLAKMMQPHEIQLIRKYRQLTPEEKIKALGYLDFMFETARVAPPPQAATADEDPPVAAPSPPSHHEVILSR
jgi:transcriptional regulator with XRE-family HTH domain